MFPVTDVFGVSRFFWGFETEQTWQAPAAAGTDPWIYNNVDFGPITLTNTNIISYWESRF